MADAPDIQFSLSVPRSDAEVVHQPSYTSRVWRKIKIRCLRAFYYIMHPRKLYEALMFSVLGMGFFPLFFVFAFSFYVLALFFSLVLYLWSYIPSQDACLLFGEASLADFHASGQTFSGVFMLSWTTLSTVGYGNTWPRLIAEDPEKVKCGFLNFVLMVEAFIGVCFGGTCGAIMLGKIDQVQNEAQIMFSHPVTIRFGSGVVDDNDCESEDEEKEETKGGDGPQLPVLEFRILNKLHDLKNGAIMDAKLGCAVGIPEDLENKEEYLDSVPMSARRRSTQRVKIPKKYFMDLKIVNSDHPFFKRCWTAMHILDEKSPLLSQKLRDRIRKNNGKWPTKEKFSTAQFIKDNLYFEELIVSFNGISKQTSCEVNAQKVYGLCDVVFGYQFVNMLQKKGDKITVIEENLNDVTEQNGHDKPLSLENE